MEWLPIDTAPKDIEDVLICLSDGTVGQASCMGVSWYWTTKEYSECEPILDIIAFWQPLPPPPVTPSTSDTDDEWRPIGS